MYEGVLDRKLSRQAALNEGIFDRKIKADDAKWVRV